jgi:hypothetical protein
VEIGVASGLIVAVIVAVFGWVWKAPRRYVVEFIRAGRRKPYSSLHAVVTGRMPPVWTRVETPDGPQVAWQCELMVTNGGNRIDSPVRGELGWESRTATFTTPLAVPNTGQIMTFLNPTWTGSLKLNAWTPLREGEHPKGALDAKITLFDRYGGLHRSRVKFAQMVGPVAPPGRCGSSSVRNGRTLMCDKPAGHDGGHSVLDPATRIASTWDENGPGPDFLVT